METFLQRVLLRAMCITQFTGSVEAFVLSTHTRVRCASVFVLYASLALHSQLIPACGVHLDADTKGRLTVNSQLIPACGVHRFV